MGDFRCYPTLIDKLSAVKWSYSIGPPCFADRRANGTLARGALFAAFFGVVAGLIIHYGFQDIFLVRVP